MKVMSIEQENVMRSLTGLGLPLELSKRLAIHEDDDAKKSVMVALSGLDSTISDLLKSIDDDDESTEIDFNHHPEIVAGKNKVVAAFYSFWSLN